MTGFDFDAVRAALEEPPSIVARVQWAMLPVRQRAAVEMSAALEDYEAETKAAARRQGFRPDGSRVTAKQKRAILAHAERVRAKHLAEVADDDTPPLAVAATVPTWATTERPPTLVW